MDGIPGGAPHRSAAAHCACSLCIRCVGERPHGWRQSARTSRTGFVNSDSKRSSCKSERRSPSHRLGLLEFDPDLDARQRSGGGRVDPAGSVRVRRLDDRHPVGVLRGSDLDREYAGQVRAEAAHADLTLRHASTRAAHTVNESLSSDGSWCDARPSARPSITNVTSIEEPPVEKSGSVSPVIGTSPRFTPTFMKKCAAK